MDRLWLFSLLDVLVINDCFSQVSAAVILKLSMVLERERERSNIIMTYNISCYNIEISSTNNTNMWNILNT